ncbi:MAG: FAD-dependent oxidoreductase [Methanomicrobiales archaeon]|nr:FAD-dependent oxidoreductase [Methanomicrobiales archaeon]
MVGVTVYSTKNCPYCRMTKAFLEKHGIKYVDIDVGSDKDAVKKMIDVSGQFGVPVTVWGDEVVVGFDSEKLHDLVGKEAGGGDFDVVIIGAGPAGLTAAMYCARKSLSTAIISEDIGGQALWSWSVDNYMGYRMVTGEDLMKKFEEQIKELPIHLHLDRVSSVKRKDSAFILETVTGKSLHAKSLIIATGKRPRTLGIKDEDAYIGHGVSVCSTCDGPLYKDKKVAVVGGGNSAFQAAIEMSGIAQWVYLIVRKVIRADPVYQKKVEKFKNITIITNTEVLSYHGKPFLDGITLKDRETGHETRIDIDGLFLEIGLSPNTEFLGDLVQKNELQEIVVDHNCHTSVEGAFAAGDVTHIIGKQIIIAAGEGAKAALEAHQHVLKG